MTCLKFLIPFASIYFLAVSSVYAAEYVAFSLKISQERVTTAKGQVSSEVFNLGGITKVAGLVYDRKTGDAIIVGEKDPERAALTLDDFVVALRARFIHGKWPLVSIDPTEETKKTEMQIVRFEGGIEDTQFGEDLFNADYRLKQIGMGLLPAGIPLKTHWDLGIERAKEGTSRSYKINSRFWFYPVLPSVSVREDVVTIKGLKVGVFTEVLSAEIDGKKIEDLSTFQDLAGDRFAKEVSDNFEKLAKVHPSFFWLQGLDELVALSKAVEEMDERPDLSFWLKDYQVKQVKTKREVEVLTRKEEYEWPVAGVIYRGYQQFSGGVQLMALALRIKAGDVTALKEAVLKTRPKEDALSWNFVVGEWLIPTSPGMLKMEDLAPLFSQAVFLTTKGHYDDALTLHGKIIELKLDWDSLYYSRGVTYYLKGQYDQAIADFNKALEINPRFVEVYANRGIIYAAKDQYELAIADFNKALELNPSLAEAYTARGQAYVEKGQYDQAIADFNYALEISPKFVLAYAGRGNAYRLKKQYGQAIFDFTKAIEINPRAAELYISLGNANSDKGQYDEAVANFNKALEINPRLAAGYYNRGVAYDRKGRYEEALLDYTKAVDVNPNYADAYNNRGIIYSDKGQYDQAIADFNHAIEINSRLAQAHYNRGLAYRRKDQYDQAILDYSKAIEINPSYVEAYFNRGAAHFYKGEYDQAISDYNQVLKVDPKWAEAYTNRGNAFLAKGDYKRAIEDYNRALAINPNEAGAANNRDVARRRLKIMDQDGRNKQCL